MAEQWRILVIEGEENLNWNMVNSLQKDGYLVRGVTSGGEAIRLLWSEEYDVVICSQHMSDTDGFDLLQWMRSYCPRARMVMLGTPNNAAMRNQALELGVASYLEKPLDLHALKEELRRMLHATGFSASLDSFDLLDVIQIITMSRKSIALIVNTGLEEQGILRFQNGELIWAEYGILRGEEAFYALAAHKNGTVAHHAWNEQITPNVTQPLSRLIFQALQYRSKYAAAIQASSELEAIRPANAQALPTLQSSVLPAALQDPDDEDRPFQFAAEDQLIEHSPTRLASEQLSTQQNRAHGDSGSSSTNQEWWEQNNALSNMHMQQSGRMRAITDAAKGVQVQLSSAQRTEGAQSHALPSWLTEQPTNHHLPVLRGQTGQMPTVPKNWAPVTPTTPTSLPYQASPAHPGLPYQASPAHPGLPYQVSPASAQGLPSLSHPSGAVWPDLSETGLRKIKPEEALYTGRQPAIRPSMNSPRPAASAEWQGPEATAMQNGNSGSLPVVKPEILQSLAALKKPDPLARFDGTSTSSEERPALVSRAVIEEPEWIRPVANSASETSISKMFTTPGQPTKYNYPALAAALQTLGYSLPGFVASAVVSLDGTPIAQVTEDDLDISPLCTHMSQVLHSALQVMQQGLWEPYEYTMMCSRTRYILLRLIGYNTDIFQILITTRETKPAESLEALANVEAAIAAALR